MMISHYPIVLKREDSSPKAGAWWWTQAFTCSVGRANALSPMMEGGQDRDNAELLVDRIMVWPAQLTAYDTGGWRLNPFDRRVAPP